MYGCSGTRSAGSTAWTEEASRRLTITDAIQPVSNAIYARRGLIAATPVLSFGGTPRVEPPPGLEPSEADPATLPAHPPPDALAIGSCTLLSGWA
jgi:hypothetical protein